MNMGHETMGRGPTYCAALIAVIILSILFVGGVIALVIGFMRQYQIYRGAGAQSEVPAVVRLAPGAHIVGVETRSGKLIVHVTTPRGSEVEIMDLSTGKLITRVEETPR
jgi:hypothetical protein